MLWFNLNFLFTFSRIANLKKKFGLFFYEKGETFDIKALSAIKQKRGVALRVGLGVEVKHKHSVHKAVVMGMGGEYFKI